MNQRKGVVVEERFQGRHLDPGPDLWKRRQDERKSLFVRPKLCATLSVVFLCFSSSELCPQELLTLAC